MTPLADQSTAADFAASPRNVAADRARGSWRSGAWTEGCRSIATETAVALTYDGSTHAVLMATPHDLVDFAVGFSLSEGVIADRREIREIEVHHTDDGIDLRIWLASDRSSTHSAKHRRMVGPTGCGLCGVESLAMAAKPLGTVMSRARFDAADVLAVMSHLASYQPLHRRTRSVHAAAFWQPGVAEPIVREDVGRHNALDKVVGAVAGLTLETGAGAVLMTSRLSVELVQKTAVMGCPLLVAISAPTSLAIDTAEAAGVTLVAVARDDGFEVFTHPGRLIL